MKGRADVQARFTWMLPDPDGEHEKRVRELAQSLRVPAAVARVLAHRGHRQSAELEQFLRPSTSQLHDPFLMRDMQEAVTRLIQAIETREHIVINGDYDTDGVTGTSLLITELRRLGARIDFFIPDREKDGYGITERLVRRAAKVGVRLLISVDCGSSDHQAIRLAHENGIDVIVVDHHEIPERPSQALAVLNPKQADCAYPFKGLSAVGVSYKLLQGIYQKRERQPAPPDGLDFVALGTLADVQPVVDENRVLVSMGLRRLGSTTRPGIRALCQVSGVEAGSCVRSGQVGFRLSPRLNAVGRVARAKLAVDLLSASSFEEAWRLAQQVEVQNTLRRNLSAQVQEDAEETAARLLAGRPRAALVLASEAWHPGVVGIGAARLVDKYGLPTILIGLQDGVGKGSARCPRDVDIRAALDESSEFLVRYGGHKQAAGLTIEEGALGAFTDRLEAAIRRQGIQPVTHPHLVIDADLEGCDIGGELLDGLEQLEPFGVDHAEPLFRVQSARVADKTRIVGQEHLKLVLEFPTGESLDAIAFRRGRDVTPKAIIGRSLDVVGTIQRQDPRFGGECQLVVSDMCVTSEVANTP